MATSAGIGVCETVPPAKRPSTCFNRCTRCNYIIHEVHRQELDGANRPYDGVLFHSETRQAKHAKPGGRLYGVSSPDRALNMGIRNQMRD